MAKKSNQRGLGRGLSALMADVQPDTASDEDQTPRDSRLLPVENIVPNPNQPRRSFDQADLDELANSIREKGIIQPLIVRENKRKSNGYEIVAGERRWRAAQLAQVHDVPVLVRDFTDQEALEIAIIENVQRADLNPIDEAAAYRQLLDDHGHTQEELSKSLGKSRSHIANTMRLLQLPDGVQALLVSGRLSAGHARALITSPDPEALAREVVTKGLSVRETERLAKAVAKPSQRKTTAPAKDADTRALEGDLSANLGMRVAIEHGSAGEGGTLSIRYKSLDQLDELCRILSGSH